LAARHPHLPPSPPSHTPPQILKRRSPISAFLEITLPLAFVVIMVALKQLPALQDRNYVGSAYTSRLTGDVLSVLPFGPAPFRLLRQNQRVAVLPSTPAAQALADSFSAHMSALHSPLNFSTVGGGQGLDTPALRAVAIPAWDEVVARFASDDDLASYVAAADYPSSSRPGIWAAVVFNAPSGGGGGTSADYSIRMNSSDATTTLAPAVQTFLTSYSPGPLRTYVSSTPSLSGTPGAADSTARLPMPGFTTLQLAVDRFLIGRNVSVQELDPLAVVAATAQALNSVGLGYGALFAAELALMNVTDPARVLLIVDDLRAWLRSETFAPQQVDFVPFPVSPYKLNLFFQVVLPSLTLLFVMAFLFPVTRLVRALVLEKEMRLRETMRTMGMSDAAAFLSWIATYGLIFALLAALIAAVGVAIFSHSSPLLVFLLFLAFGSSATTFCLLVSVFFTKSRTASVLGGILFFASFFAFFAVNGASASIQQLSGGALLAPTALGLAIDALGTLEANSVGLTAGTWAAPGGTSGTWSVGASFGMLVFDTLLYAAIAVYADAVLPARLREYGVPRPWYFLVLPSFWREMCGCGGASAAASSSFSSSAAATGDAAPTPSASSSINNEGGHAPSKSSSSSSSSASRFLSAFTRRRAGDGLDSKPRAAIDPSFLELPDSALRAKAAAGKCVAVRGLRKEFDTPDGTKVAVDNVDLTMYEGQIFVLLGHNGAGKTTTISMLTGLIPPTSGGATVFGRDVTSEGLASIRRTLGVCPQHDVLWPELTVKEHLELYAAIKGVPAGEVPAAIAEALGMVGLTEKLDAQSGTLSGGQKRKLSVCIAFLGGSKVVFLDEPTSGMDPYSRRSTWQILQNAREGRVIVLTTHFMDEADILGDRVAIMADGQVRCSGTPMFLKQKFGVGYVLTLVKSAAHHHTATPAAEQAIVDLARAHVPEASVATNVGAELNLRFPLAAARAFPALLADLDANMGRLGLASYGISVTSIEDIFLQIAEGMGTSKGLGGVGSDDDAPHHTTAITVQNPLAANTASGGGASSSPFIDAGNDGVAAARAQAQVKQTAVGAFIQHFGALLAKRARYSRRDYRAMCCQLLVPIVLLVAGLAFIRAFAITDPPDYIFTTNDFNIAGPTFGRAPRGVGPSSSSDGPAYPNYVPTFVFKSASDAGTAGPDSSANISALLRSVPAVNLSTDGSALVLSHTQAQALDAADAYGFITSTDYPERDWQRMSTFLIQNRGQYAASKYGAYVFTRQNTFVPGQDPDATLPATGITTYSAFVNTSARHAAPLYMNLMNSALLRSATGDAAADIRARNHPLPFTAVQRKFVLATQSIAVVQVVLIALAFVPAAFVMYVVKEREVGAKHQQTVSGVSTSAYWTTNFLYDSASSLLPAALAVAVVYGFSVGSLTQTAMNKLAGFVLPVVLYGPASASFSYVLSHAFSSHSTAQAAMVMVNIISFGGVIVMLALQNIDSTCADVPSISAALRILPMFAMGNSLVQLSFMELLPQFRYSCDASVGTVGPASDYAPYTSALDLGVTGAGIVYLAVSALVYLVLAILLDVALSTPSCRRSLDRLPWAAPKNVPMDEPPPADEDVDVADERARVSAQMGADGGRVSDVILLDRLRRVYKGGKVAVRNLSFGVPLGQVFGFLGINGAGKSSALKMLTGDILPTSGTARLAGYDIITEQPEVRRLLGYCPQFDALLDLLTVQEHLELYARIKGVPEARVAAAVEAQLDAFDLRPYANKLAGTLSGGNKRKTSVAVALIGAPPLVFLDEPSTGMDPVARRFMWRAIARVATERKQCSIILTTHSMEEVEALCERIGIMVGGRLRCLGTAQHLKNTHGQGFMSDMRLATPTLLMTDAVLVAIQRILGPAAAASGQAEGAQLPQVCASLGKAGRANELSPQGSGWAIAATVASSATHSVPIREFAEWWAEEDVVESAAGFVCGPGFPGARLLERQGLNLRFAIPPQADSLATMFTKLEGARQVGVATYTLGQTTLEQVFNSFAAQQDEEHGMARGFGGAPAAAAAAGPPAGGPSAAVVSVNPMAAAVAAASGGSARGVGASGGAGEATVDWARRKGK
jgi:ATP-binding cassette, subfamily A (ABC1), member 3